MLTTLPPSRGTVIQGAETDANSGLCSITVRWGAALLWTRSWSCRSAGRDSGIPDTIPTDWVTVTPGPGADMVQFIPLPGVRTRSAFGQLASAQSAAGDVRAVRFSSADGTPLAGILGVHGDATPRPGVVLVPGFQTTGHEFIVELADLCFSETAGRCWQSTCQVTGSVARCRRPSSRGAGRRQQTWGPSDSCARPPRQRTAIGFSDGGRSLVQSDGGRWRRDPPRDRRHGGPRPHNARRPPPPADRHR